MEQSNRAPLADTLQVWLEILRNIDVNKNYYYFNKGNLFATSFSSNLFTKSVNELKVVNYCKKLK